MCCPMTKPSNLGSVDTQENPNTSALSCIAVGVGRDDVSAHEIVAFTVKIFRANEAVEAYLTLSIATCDREALVGAKVAGPAAGTTVTSNLVPCEKSKAIREALATVTHPVLG